MGAASLHRYFPTTSAIFAEVSRQTYRTLIQQIRDLTARTDLDLRSMIEAICQTAVAGPGLSLEHRRRLNLEIPLVWSMGVAEEVYAEVIDTVATWIRANVASPPEDLEVRIFVAFGMVRGCILMGLLFPGITPPSDRLLPTLVDSVHRILGEESPGVG